MKRFFPVILLVILSFSTIPPTVNASGVDVYTNKGGQGIGNTNGGTYQVGETITLHIKLWADTSSSVLKIYRPDGTIIPYERGPKKAGTYQISSSASFPGRRQVVIEVYWTDVLFSASGKDELYFDVVDYEAEQRRRQEEELRRQEEQRRLEEQRRQEELQQEEQRRQEEERSKQQEENQRPREEEQRAQQETALERLENDEAAQIVGKSIVAGGASSIVGGMITAGLGGTTLAAGIGASSIVGIVMLPTIAGSLVSTMVTMEARRSGMGVIESAVVGGLAGSATSIVATLVVAMVIAATAPVSLPLIAIGIGVSVGLSILLAVGTAKSM